MALVAIGLPAVAGPVVGRSGGRPAQEATVAAPSIAGEDAEPVARGGLLAGADVATPSPSAPAVTEPPVREVAADADEPAPTRRATVSTTAPAPQPAIEASASEDEKPARCTEERGSGRGKGAGGSRRGGAACR